MALRGSRAAGAIGAAAMMFALLAPAAVAAPTSSASSPAPASPSVAGSPSAAGAATVTASGTAAGALAVGSTIDVKILASDSLGWQHLDTMEVSLRLNGQPLDTIQVVPSAFSIAIVNSGAPVSIGEPGILKGPWFRVENAKSSPSASGNVFRLRFPLRLALDPPPGALLVLNVTDASTVSSGDVALSPPVTTQDQGFPWGTIGLAVAGALFIGGFVGNMFSTRRAKARPNVYATVARRLEEERSKR